MFNQERPTTVENAELKPLYSEDDKGIKAWDSYLGIGISIYEGGEFQDLDGKKVKYGAGQKIIVGGGSGKPLTIKLSPAQLLYLRQFLGDDHVTDILKSRMKAEREKVRDTYARLL